MTKLDSADLKGVEMAGNEAATGRRGADLDEIRALEKAATNGPWLLKGVDMDLIFGPNQGLESGWPIAVAQACYPHWRADAAFIAAARTAVPALLAEVERLEGLVNAYKRKRWHDYLDWSNSGGPNECPHGRAVGIDCPRCDDDLIAEFEAR